MKRIFPLFFISFIFLFLSGLFFIFFTEPGLKWVLKYLEKVTDHHFSVKSAKGKFIGQSPINLNGLYIRLSSVDIQASEISLDLRLYELLSPLLYISEIKISDLKIIQKQSLKKKNESESLNLNLPFGVLLKKAHVDDIQLIQADKSILRFNNLNLKGELDENGLIKGTTSLDTSFGSITLAGQFEIKPDIPIDLNTDLKIKIPKFISPVHINGVIKGTINNLKIFQQIDKPSQIKLNAVLENVTENPSFNIDARWKDLLLTDFKPDFNELKLFSPSGNIKIYGSLKDYKWKAKWLLSFDNLPQSKIDMEGNGSDSFINVSGLEGRWIGGIWKGKGKFDWHLNPTWEASFQVKDAHPEEILPQWPGRLSGNLSFDGKISKNNQILFKSKMRDIDGILRGYQFFAKGDVLIDGDQYFIKDIDIKSGSTKISGSADLSKVFNIKWAILSNNLAEIYSDLKGSISAKGTIKGPKYKIFIDSNIFGKNLQAGNLSFKSLEAQVKSDFSPNGLVNVNVNCEKINLDSLKFEHAYLTGKGSADNHNLKLVMDNKDKKTLQIEVNGGFEKNRWIGLIKNGSINLPYIGNWIQDGSSEISVSLKDISISPLCGIEKNSRVCLTGDWSKTKGLSVKIAAKEVPVEKIKSFISFKQADLSGNIDGTATITYKDDNFQNIQFTGRSAKGKFKFRVPDGQYYQKNFKNMDFKAQWDSNGINGKIYADFDKGEYVDGDISLYGLKIFSKPKPDQTVSGNIKISLNDFNIIPLLIPDIHGSEGIIYLNLILSGTFFSPKIDGKLDISNTSMSVGLLGINIHDLFLTAKSQNTNGILLEGSLSSGKGKLKILGNVLFNSQKNWEANFDIKGDRFEALRIPDAQITASPDLKLKIVPKKIWVEGDILIPEADIHPVLEKPEISASQDVVIEGIEKKSPERSEWEVRSKVVIKLGDMVNVKAYGFKGRLSGQVKIMEEEKITKAQGELLVLKGSYRTYGQEFPINEGRLIFPGGPLTNPGIDIRSLRKIGDIQVGFVASGTFENTKLRLFSDPPMEDSDTLSYLITGRPIRQASQSEGKMMYKAASSLGMAGAGFLTDYIAKRFGIDELRLDSDGDIKKTSLVVGTYLSPRLYVSYIAGLLERMNIVRIRYQLSKNWTIETEAGQKSGADLKYTLER